MERGRKKFSYLSGLSLFFFSSPTERDNRGYDEDDGLKEDGELASRGGG